MKFIKKIRRYYKRLKLLNSAYDTLIDVLKIDSLDECYIKFNSKSMNFIDSCALDRGCGEFQKIHLIILDLLDECKGFKDAISW